MTFMLIRPVARALQREDHTDLRGFRPQIRPKQLCITDVEAHLLTGFPDPLFRALIRNIRRQRRVRIPVQRKFAPE